MPITRNTTIPQPFLPTMERFAPEIVPRRSLVSAHRLIIAQSAVFPAARRERILVLPTPLNVEARCG